MHGVDVNTAIAMTRSNCRLGGRVVSFLEEDMIPLFTSITTLRLAVENAWELRHMVEELIRRNDAQRSYAIPEVG